MKCNCSLPRYSDNTFCIVNPAETNSDGGATKHKTKNKYPIVKMTFNVSSLPIDLQNVKIHKV